MLVTNIRIYNMYKLLETVFYTRSVPFYIRSVPTTNKASESILGLRYASSREIGVSEDGSRCTPNLRSRCQAAATDDIEHLLRAVVKCKAC
jgi:hypothetical protein